MTNRKWHALPKEPNKTGKYILGHRGHQVVTHWLDPKGLWATDTKTGWQCDISFGPTHWMALLDMEYEDESFKRFEYAKAKNNFPPKRKQIKPADRTVPQIPDGFPKWLWAITLPLLKFENMLRDAIGE